MGKGIFRRQNQKSKRSVWGCERGVKNDGNWENEVTLSLGWGRLRGSRSGGGEKTRSSVVKVIVLRYLFYTQIEKTRRQLGRKV